MNDPAETEADRVADQVMRMPEPTTGITGPPARRGEVRRVCAQCEAEAQSEPVETVHRMEETEEELQMKPAAQTVQRAETAATPLGKGHDRALRGLGPGAPLPASERAFFEPRFGRDLSGVRVHSGSKAHEASRSINARAFTLGGNVAFAHGEYQPGTHQGRRLLAHELTHTLQQGHAGEGVPTVRRTSIEDCGEAEGAVLEAHSQGRKLLKTAMAMTKRRDARSDRIPEVKTALLEWFKIDLDNASMAFENAQNLIQVQATMETILDGSDDASYQCSGEGPLEPCWPGLYAFAAVDIHLCPFWRDNAGSDWKALVLIHEWGHKYGEGINRFADTYCHEAAFATLTSSERMKQPDAYAGYVGELGLGYQTCVK